MAAIVGEINRIMVACVICKARVQVVEMIEHVTWHTESGTLGRWRWDGTYWRDDIVRQTWCAECAEWTREQWEAHRKTLHEG